MVVVVSMYYYKRLRFATLCSLCLSTALFSCESNEEFKELNSIRERIQLCISAISIFLIVKLCLKDFKPVLAQMKIYIFLFILNY